MARRSELEVFGLSMLDTVTCGLGGAIVLMLLIASLIPPEADVNFSNQTAIEIADDGQKRSAAPSATTATGILTVFFKLDRPYDSGHFRLQPCIGSLIPNEASRLRRALLRGPTADDIFASTEERREFGHTLWWSGPAEELPREMTCLKVDPKVGCEYRYIAGAHLTDWRRCQGSLEFLLQPEGFYKLKEAGP